VGHGLLGNECRLKNILKILEGKAKCRFPRKSLGEYYLTVDASGHLLLLLLRRSHMFLVVHGQAHKHVDKVLTK
jgi:hypothetical protein